MSSCVWSGNRIGLKIILMCFILGVPTVPLLPPQVNQSLASVPPINPATTLPSKQQARDLFSNGVYF